MQYTETFQFIELLTNEISQRRIHSELGIKHNDPFNVVDLFLFSKLLHQTFKKTLLISFRL